MKQIKFIQLIVLLLTFTTIQAQDNPITCKDAEKLITKSLSESYDPVIKYIEAQIEAMKSANIDPCKYYNVAVKEVEDWCAYLEVLKKSKRESIVNAVDEIDCLNNNTEVTAQNVLNKANEIGVKLLERHLGLDLPKKMFYVSLLDIQEHGITGGENSLINVFKSQLDDFKSSLPEIGGGVKVPTTTQGLPEIKIKTNKHGLLDIPIDLGIKF